MRSGPGVVGWPAASAARVATTTVPSGSRPTGYPEAVLDASTVKGGGKAATEVVGIVDVTRGEAVIVFGWATADALANGLGHY